MQHVGGEREGLADEAHLLAGPVRVGLLAPIQERGLAAIQADPCLEHRLAILCQGGLQCLPDLVGEGRVIQQPACGQEPHHAVAADRPAAPGAGVLGDEQARRMSIARGGKLELQRLACAYRIQTRQRQIGSEADITRPHIRPALTGLEACAGNRLAVIEGRVTDRLHAVGLHLLLGQPEQRIEQHAAGLAAHRLRADAHLALRRMQKVATCGGGLGARMAAVEIQVGRACGGPHRCPEGNGQADHLQHRSGEPARASCLPPLCSRCRSAPPRGDALAAPSQGALGPW